MLLVRQVTPQAWQLQGLVHRSPWWVAVVTAGAQEESPIAVTRLTVKKMRRGFIMFILFIRVYHKMIACFYIVLTLSHKTLKREIRHSEKQSLYFDGCEILRYTSLVK